MGCKSCGKNNKGLAGKLLGDSRQKSIKSDLDSYGVDTSMLDDSVFSATRIEQIILILFAWIPLIIGYYTIIRLIISLF